MKLKVKSVFIILLIATTSFAWNDEKTHPTISKFAAKDYFGADFMDEYVNGKQVSDLIQEGAKLEDYGTLLQFLGGTARSLNHFHNASKANLGEAGLNDLPFFISNGKSALLWAQDGPYQESKVGGNWSWPAVRDYWYNNLTATTDTATNYNLVKMLQGLGYQMHMIQDMGQPNHVRNDTHVLDGASWIMGLETWAKKNDDKVLGMLQNTPAVTVDLNISFGTEDATKAPVARLFDTRGYKGARQPTATLDQGLAEYTNSNFFSESTIFASEYATDDKHYQPYPKKSETNVQDYINNLMALTPVTNDEDFGPYETFFVTKQNTSGQKLNCLATSGPFSRKILQEMGEGKNFYRSFMYDTCFQEYAEKLIPASATYSIAMLDYFFRGEIELTLPSTGVYSAAPAGNLFTELRVNAKNITETGEEMTDGSVELAVTYNIAQADPFQSIQITVDPQYHHIVVPEKNNVRTIPKNTTKELVFDLTASPIPIWATDVEIRVVYKGKLGVEEKAVASGVNDISESTPVDVYNNTDYTCLNNSWYRYDDPAAMAIVDSNNDQIADKSDIYPHIISNIAFQAGPAGATLTASSSHNNLFSNVLVQPGQWQRLGYILTEYSNSYTFDETWTNMSEDDIWEVGETSVTQAGEGFIQQADKGFGEMYTIRGKKMWWGAGLVYDNQAYPSGSTCDWKNLPN